jgi:hypothetical protein
MALLQYDFAVVNQNALAAILASNERRIAQHNARVARLVGTPVSRARSSARAVVTDESSAAAALDRQRSAALLQLHRAEQRQKLAAERVIQREGMRLDRERVAAAKALDRQRATALFAQHRASERAAASAARRERMDRRAIAGAVTGRIGRSLSNTVSSVGSMAVGALGIGGSIAAGSAISTQMAESAKASNLANQAGRPEIKGTLLREAQGVQGFTGMEALEGMEAFVTKTGNLDAARALMGELSTLALATGANLGDLGMTAGQAFNVLKGQISDPVELLKQVKELMPVLAQQGRMGAVEIKDLATEFGKLGAATRGFEGEAPDLLRSMGAFAQIAMEKGGASTSSDAATAAARMAGDIVTNRKKFAALGVDVQSKTDKTKLRAPEQIMLDVLEKTGGDITKTSGLFGMESRKVFSGVAATFSEAEQRKKGSGRAAAEAEFLRFAGAKADPEEIRRQAASTLDEPAMKLKEAMKQFNAAIGSELLPVLTRLIPEFTKLLPALTRGASALAGFVDSIIKDPITGIGQIIAAKVALDLAGAGIGAAARYALTQALAGIRIPLPGGAPVPVGGVGAGTAAGAAAGGAPVALVGAGLLAATAGMVATKQQIGANSSTLSGLAKGAAVDFVGQNSSLGLAGMALYQGGKAFMGAFGDKPPSMPGAPGSPTQQALTLMPEQGASAEQRANSQQAINSAPLNKAADKLSAAADKLASSGGLNRGNTPAPPVP